MLVLSEVSEVLCESKGPWCECLNQQEPFQAAWPISGSFKHRIDSP